MREIALTITGDYKHYYMGKYAYVHFRRRAMIAHISVQASISTAASRCGIKLITDRSSYLVGQPSLQVLFPTSPLRSDQR